MRKNKKVIILSLMVISIGMIVGFSILSKQLKIEGTATIDSSFDVAITDISNIGDLSTNVDLTQDDSSVVKSYEKEEPTHTTDTATFNVVLNDTKVNYNVTISNNGTDGAIIDNVSINTTSEAVVAELISEISGVYIAPGESITLTLQISRDKSISFSGSSTVTVTVNTKQYTSEEKIYPDPVLAFVNFNKESKTTMISLASEFGFKVSTEWTLLVSIDDSEFTEVETNSQLMGYDNMDYTYEDGHTYKFKAHVKYPNGDELDSRVIVLQS